MAEQSIRIADAASGLRMAARDAFENDGSGNARVVERVDFASGKFTTPIGNATRGNSSLITVVDTLDLTNLPADLTDNMIIVGDKSTLCVASEQSVSGGTVIVTPIVYDNEVAPSIVTILDPKLFTQPYAFRRGSASGNYVLPVKWWDAAGAHKIGLHITVLSGSGNGVKLWGWVL